MVERLSERSKETVALGKKAIIENRSEKNIHRKDFHRLTKEIRTLRCQQSKAARFDWMKKLAQEEPIRFLSTIWTTYDPDTLTEYEAVELLKICAKKHAKLVLDRLQNYKITNKVSRYEIALICTETSLDLTLENFHVFNIKNKGLLADFARHVGNKNFLTLVKYLDKIAIGKEHFFEILVNATHRHHVMVICNIQNIDLEEENDRIKIAEICAREYGAATAKNIKNFNITDEAGLIHIAKLCLSSYYPGAAEVIDLFGIKNPAALAELAELSAQKWPENTAKFIEKFGIQDQKVLYRIAKICATNPNYTGSYNNTKFLPELIPNFNILSEEKRIKLARICAMRDGKETARFFHNFKITDEKVRVEIAKLCAAQNGTATAQFFKNFNISDENDRIAIAKIAAQGKNNEIAKWLDNFQITNREALVDIVFILAKNFNYDAPQYFYKFKIDSHKTRIELAKIFAQNHGEQTARCIRDFGIKSKKARIKIAKLCALSDGSGLAKYIRNFHITDEKILYRLAKLSIHGYLEDTIEYFSNFGLKNQKQISHLIKLCAKIDGGSTAQKFKYFGLTDENLIYKIAKLCAISDAEHMLPHIKEFKITDPVKFERILKIAFFHAVKALDYVYSDALVNAPISDKTKRELNLYCFRCRVKYTEEFRRNTTLPHRDLPDLFYIKQNHSWESILKVETFIELIRPLSEKNVLPLVSQLEKLKDPESKLTELQKNDLFHSILLKAQMIDAMYTYIERSDLLKRELIDSDLFTQVLNFWQPELRWDLFHSLLPVYSDSPPNTKFRTRFYTEQLTKAFALQGVNQEIIQKFLDRVFSHNQNFKDGRVGSVLIRLLVTMIKHPLLNSKMKGKILKKIISEAHTIRENNFKLRYPQAAKLSEARRTEMRNAYDKKNSSESQLLSAINSALILLDFNQSKAILKKGLLSEMVETEFQRRIPCGKIDQFADKFHKTFGSSRIPEAVVQYAASISKLQNQKAMGCFTSYFASVLEGTFQNYRYDTSESEHLQILNKFYPDIYANWQKSSSYSFDELGVSTVKTDNTPFDYNAWLRRKIADDHLHLNENGFTYLAKFRDKTQDVESLIKELEAIPPDTENYKNLRFQMLCLLLTKNESTTNELLAELKLILSSPPYNHLEFYHDVRGRLEPVYNRQGAELLVVNSDSPYDLLLAGAEISGSCQRVNGSPATNKGLLGYIKHGWNRILKVSDSIDGKIQARCIIKVLWDGEKPVLFRERLYPDPISPAHEQALNKAAARLAAELGIPLLSSDAGEPYNKNIFALGGGAPYEYSDANGSNQDNGKYVITDAKYLRSL